MIKGNVSDFSVMTIIIPKIFSEFLENAVPK